MGTHSYKRISEKSANHVFVSEGMLAGICRRHGCHAESGLAQLREMSASPFSDLRLVLTEEHAQVPARAVFWRGPMRSSCDLLAVPVVSLPAAGSHRAGVYGDDMSIVRGGGAADDPIGLSDESWAYGGLLSVSIPD